MRYLSYIAAFGLIVCITVAGCSDDPRIDGRDKDTFNKSLDVMELTLNKEEKMRFMLAIIVLSGKAQRIKPDDPGSVMRLLLHEKTYREIVEFAAKAGSMSHRTLEDSYKDQLKVINKTGGNILTEELIAEEITSKFVENRHDGRLFIIQGKVHNRMTSPRKNVRVNGRLYTAKHVVASEMSCAGRVLTEKELVNLPYSKIKRQLNADNDSNNKAMIIAEGGELPFMIVFPDVSSPANLDEFTVDIAGSERCSMWSGLVEVISSRIVTFRN